MEKSERQIAEELKISRYFVGKIIRSALKKIRARHGCHLIEYLRSNHQYSNLPKMHEPKLSEWEEL